MTIAEIEAGFKATIDQFYDFRGRIGYVDKEEQLHHIGGILQAALHILPTDRYFALKQYIYDKHGYNPGGVDTGQINLEEYMAWKDS